MWKDRGAFDWGMHAATARGVRGGPFLGTPAGVGLPKRYEHLVGAKFTSVVEVKGWRQFHVVGLRKVDDGYDAELRASCAATVELRVPAKALFDGAAWIPGWLPLSKL